MTNKDLQKARVELDMTQQELAEALGIQRNTITRYEIGLLETPRPIHLAVQFLLLEHRSQLAKERMEEKRVRGKVKKSH